MVAVETLPGWRLPGLTDKKHCRECYSLPLEALASRKARGRGEWVKTGSDLFSESERLPSAQDACLLFLTYCNPFLF